jgi:hypothetical protein
VRPEERTGGRATSGYRPGQTPVTLGDERDDEVKIKFAAGYLNQGDIDEAMERHTPDLIACYDRAGRARKYASGQVVLRFLVSSSGAVSDVLVVGNQLGNYAVERCLVVEGRKIPFPAPGGGKEADFEYTIEFRASGEVAVIDWQPEAVRRDVAARLPSLAGCGRPSDEEVHAVAYVQPGGSVVSVGLVSPGRLEIMSAMCVVEQIRKWRLPGDSSHVVRTSFPIVRRSAAASVSRRSVRLAD